MSALIDGLLIGWHKNVEYMKKLVADVPPEKMAYQPHAKMNHPAWVLSHLNIYHSPMVLMTRGESFTDVRDHKYGMTSQCVADASLYAGKQELIDAFILGHEKVEAAIKAMDVKVFDRQTPLERWRSTMPLIGNVLPYLMLVHESTHIGQLSAWRRAQGMPSV